MSDDVWTALVKGSVSFAHSRAARLTATTFKDAGSLVGSLFDGAPPGNGKTRLQQLKADIAALKDEAKPIIEAVNPKAKAAADAVSKMAAELATSPFTMEAAGRAATELAYALIALDEAILVIADKVSKSEPEPGRASMKNDIANIAEPWKAPFAELGANASQSFDVMCKTLLDIDQAGQRFAQQLKWSRPDKKLSLVLQKIGNKSLHANFAFDGASVEAFFQFKDTAKLGIALKANLDVGLTGDPFLAKIMPGKTAASTTSTAITLDTKDGLTFGEGPNRRVVLPMRLKAPGIELRQFAIARPEQGEVDEGRVHFMVTVAGKLGSTFAAVAEDGGVTVRWTGGGFDVEPKVPTGIGLRIETGLVRGGGFIRHKPATGEYGGVLDLQFAKIGITAIGLIGTRPRLSVVIVIGVRFTPKIELSFGFTLSGIGGLLAIDRRLDSDALRKGIREGAVAMLLFPESPVAAAPQILDRLGAIFPPADGAFVVGPMVELGWGSQAGFVKARLGVVLALPDPRIVVLGTLQVGVPSAEIDPKLRIVDLRGEVFGEITPDDFLTVVNLAGSRMATIGVSGEMGVLIRWGGGAVFALSVGGFYPKYPAPPELADLKRVALQLAPPVSILKVRAQAYFAITGSSLQWGGGVWFLADLEVISGEAWLTVDAILQWAPRIAFLVTIECGITIRALGEEIAGVTFRGELGGMRPWRLRGHARCKIFGFKKRLDIPVVEWGERDNEVAEAVRPARLVRDALESDTAWTTKLPADADAWVRLAEDRATPLLVHPLGALEVKQLAVPLEVEIDRVGSSPVTSRRTNLTAVRVGSQNAQVLSHANDRFAPSHYFERTKDQVFSNADFAEHPCGMRLAASREAESGNPSSVEVAWNTVYPHRGFASDKSGWSMREFVSTELLLRNGAVARAARERHNPYLPTSRSTVAVGPVPPIDGLSIREPGVVQLANKLDLRLHEAGTPMPYVQAQRHIDAVHRERPSVRLAAVAQGVLA